MLAKLSVGWCEILNSAIKFHEATKEHLQIIIFINSAFLLWLQNNCFFKMEFAWLPVHNNIALSHKNVWSIKTWPPSKRSPPRHAGFFGKDTQSDGNQAHLLTWLCEVLRDLSANGISKLCLTTMRLSCFFSMTIFPHPHPSNIPGQQYVSVMLLARVKDPAVTKDEGFHLSEW